jgi:hypothetical protein
MAPQLPETGQGPVTRIYDFYGSPDADTKRVSDLIAAAAGVTFERRISADRGEYYLANGPAAAELVVEPNEIEDEEGKFFKQPDYADSMTLLLAWHKAASEADAAAVLDGLRERLGPVDGLVFLRRRQSTRPSAKRAAGSP